ncbi:Craniofacial development protein, putative [Pediculus humanus corporis]|uniref:Craniofacial development protein, putative n=1 Tax=Pediculus humanus subsp. corporis TaxID=121224 RepID=E0VCY4_PEDHC|nr:Craniofacial development protein, putative [Pediculus humanus corporis]EEB11240.1 Craniofacial development protein, putative [Pediculus humanus corporis]
MDEKNLPSSSDESDVDFVPEGEESESGSGSEETDNENQDDSKNGNTRKKSRNSKKSNKRLKTDINEEKLEDENEKTEKKIDVDALWADFKSDVNNKVKKTATSSVSKVEEKESNSNANEIPVEKKLLSNKLKGIPSVSNKSKIGGLSNIGINLKEMKE